MPNPVPSGYEQPLNVRLNIDMFHVEKGVKELEKLSKRLTEAVEREALQEFAQRVVDRLRLNIKLAGYPALASKIRVKYRRGKITILVDDPTAAYLEYGTGIVGSSNKHPEASLNGWGYMIGDYSGRGGGWFYPAVKVYPHQKTFVAKNGQLYAYTNGGLKAGMFTYKTMLWARKSYTRYFRKVLRAAVKSRGGK